MSKIVLSSDSVCDLNEELISRHCISIMPLLVGLGETYYQDGVDIAPADIYAYVDANKVLPKTAARGVADYIDYFTALSEGGKEVIHFAISADMSSSYQNAMIAAGEVGDSIHVIDSRNLSTGIGLLILDAAQMCEQGKNADEIINEITVRTAQVRASFVVDTLDYLRMGGRCSAVAALGANMLKLHPCIEVKDGKMGVGTKYRGPLAKVILQYANEKLTKTENIRKDKVFITHASCDDAIVASVKAKVEELGIFDNIYVTKAGSTINSHCGQGTLGVLFEVEA